MLAAVGMVLAWSQGTPALPDVGVQQQVTMPIIRHVPAGYDPERQLKDGRFVFGTQDVEVQMGEVSWSMQNATLNGAPCKLFRGNSRWIFRPAKVKNKKIVFTPTLYSFAWISPEGRLLKSSTSYAGLGAAVQVEAVYRPDSVDITKTEGRNISQTTLYPKFPMSLFDRLFDPLMKDGLIQSQGRDLAFLHPVTGAPVVVHIGVGNRFQGKLQFREYEGYRFESTSPDGGFKAGMMVSRHGQALQIDLPEKTDAVAYLDVTHLEEQRWGKFKSTDWSVAASQAQPGRARFTTMGMPIYLINPTPLVVPIPYAVAL